MFPLPHSTLLAAYLLLGKSGEELFLPFENGDVGLRNLVRSLQETIDLGTILLPFQLL